MAIEATLARIGDVFGRLATHAPFVGERELSDFRPEPPTFDVEADYDVLGDKENLEVTKPGAGEAIEFGAFIDGVQRSTVLTRVPVGGFPVPIHIAQVGSAVVRRDSHRRLRVVPGLMASRVLLLAPFRAMREGGWTDFETFHAGAAQHGFGWDRDDERVYQVPDGVDVLVCDTTDTGIGLEQGEGTTSFTRMDLGNAAIIAGRAIGRVKWLRAILEIMTLVEYRSSVGSDDWILLDGPLIFLRKQSSRLRRLSRYAGHDPLIILKRVVGLVKEVRLRLKASELKRIYDMQEDECSGVVALSQCVNLTGMPSDGDEAYDKKHLTMFARLRRPRIGLHVPTGDGIVGIDTYLSTYGFSTSDEVTTASMREEGRLGLVRKIVRGVWRERWPGVRDRNRALTQVYPIEQTERLLQSRLFSLREMAYLASRLRLV